MQLTTAIFSLAVSIGVSSLAYMVRTLMIRKATRKAIEEQARKMAPQVERNLTQRVEEMLGSGKVTTTKSI